MTNPEDLLVTLKMHEDNIYSSRANFLLTLQGFIFNAFAILVASSSMKGLLQWIPAILCVASMVLNILWETTNRFQLDKKIKPLKDELAQKNVLLIGKKNYYAEDGKFLDIYKWAPILLVIAWGAILAVYLVYITVGLGITF